MPSENQEAALALERYTEFLRWGQQQGYEFVVIGGCAVGAYAHLRGETVLSGDLDLLADRQTLEEMLAALCRSGVGRVVKRPRPRALQVAVLDWQGLTIDVLTECRGLPDTTFVVRNARAFRLEREGLEILLADPFDLLANKLSVDRPKDRPHQALLMQFIEEEVVAAFRQEEQPRARHAPARRLLAVTDQRTLPPALATRLLALAREPADYRFLVHHWADRESARLLVSQAPGEELRLELEDILARREL